MAWFLPEGIVNGRESGLFTVPGIGEECMRIGISELILVFVVALFVIGPDKLPFYTKKLGEALGEFRKASDKATADIRSSIVEPLEEAQKPLREAVEPFTELQEAVNGNLKDVQKSLNNIGKNRSPKKENKGIGDETGAGGKSENDVTEPATDGTEIEVKTVADESAGMEPATEGTTITQSETATGETAETVAETETTSEPGDTIEETDNTISKATGGEA